MELITRKYVQINLDDQSITSEDWQGEALVKAGRHLIAKTLLDLNVARVDPLGPDNPLIFSAGPLAGTTFSNANRTSVGCKSPLTGGIKEANAGGTLAYAMGRMNIAGFTLHQQSDEWVTIVFRKDGSIKFEPAEELMGLSNSDAATKLFEIYGKKIAFAICGPVGEYLGLMAGVMISDSDGRASRIAARGGVGAVMGSKKVKAIVFELDKIPNLHDKKKTFNGVKQYANLLGEDPIVQIAYKKIGTMGTGDYVNHVGGIPTNNFSSGSQVDDSVETFTMGGEFIEKLNTSRGGKHSHACMPGCAIQCSNVYVDENGKEITSPVEYETLALLGTNCGLTNPDDLAMLNQHCNDLGIDTIEAGATIAVLMEAGLAEFGDVAFMESVFREIAAGSEKGKLWAQGTAYVGEHYGVKRVPVIKRQAISAYDPRVIEATGISMMTTAMGADHTTGNVFKVKSRDKDVEYLMDRSLEIQISCAATDSIGFCVFGRTTTNPNITMLADTINAALGTEVAPTFFHEIGREVLRMEHEFTKLAGFTTEDNDLPEFMYEEELKPTNQAARFRGEDVKTIWDRMDGVGPLAVPDEYGKPNHE